MLTASIGFLLPSMALRELAVTSGVMSPFSQLASSEDHFKTVVTRLRGHDPGSLNPFTANRPPSLSVDWFSLSKGPEFTRLPVAVEEKVESFP